MIEKLSQFFFLSEIEYSMPLRKDPKRRSAELDSKSVDSVSDTTMNEQENNVEDDDEAHDGALLESLGIENSEILKINHSQVRRTSNTAAPRAFVRFVVLICRKSSVSDENDHG